MSTNESQPSSTGLDPNLAALLAYLVGFISGLVLLVVEKRSEYVRFHAYQATVTFLALFVAGFVLRFVPLLGDLLGPLLSLVSLVLWVLLMVKAIQGERFKLPMLGDMAEERSKL